MKKSKSGYKRSRANAITHGFYATDELFLASLKPKERRSFNKLRDTLHTEYHPQTVRETILVDRLAILHFRQYRLYSLEALAIDQTGTKPLAPGSILAHLDRFSRYDGRIEKQIRALNNRLYWHFNSRRDYSLSFYRSGE